MLGSALKKAAAFAKANKPKVGAAAGLKAGQPKIGGAAGLNAGKPKVGTAKGAKVGGSAGTKKAAPKPKPKAPSVSYSGGGGSTGAISGSIGSTGSAAVKEPPKPKQLSEKDWRAQDSAFKAEQSSIEAELKSMIANIASQRKQYGTDMGMSFRNLGLQQGKKDDWTDATWNRDDLLGAYGQSVNNQVNDFAARGLLDSGLYIQDHDDLTRGFDRQRSDLLTNQQDTLADFLRQEQAAKTSSSNAIERARAESAMRRAAAYGLTGV